MAIQIFLNGKKFDEKVKEEINKLKVIFDAVFREASKKEALNKTELWKETVKEYIKKYI